MALIAGTGGGGALLVVIVLIIVLANQESTETAQGNGGTDPALLDLPAGSPPSRPQTPQDRAANQAAYEARLEQQRAIEAQRQRDDLAGRHGGDKVVSVVITGVPGERAAADKYLHRKIFRAAYHYYSEAQKQAQAATEQAREQAAQAALAQHQQTWGGGIGPTFVWYRYKPVESNLPYPRIVKGAAASGTFTYHATPVQNLQDFAVRVGVGAAQIDVSNRTVYIQAQLPDPVPDPDVEELVIQHGPAGVAKVEVSGALGEADRVTYYLEKETSKLDPEKNLSIAGLKPLGDGKYQFTVAPVTNLVVFSERIPWGQTESIDEATRTLRVAARLPEELPRRPTAAEEAELRRQEWEAWRNRPTDFDREPKSGEDFYDWALRVIKGGHVFARQAALTQLRIREPEPEKLEEVSKVLIATLSDAGTLHLEEHLEAMLVWRTAETEKAILALGGSHEAFANRTPLMNALAKLGTRDAARALASGLNDFFVGDKVVSRLIEIGPVAEEFVLPFLDNSDARVRQRAYAILDEIGGRRSLSKLRANIGKERNDQMKELARSTHLSAKERADAADAAAAAEKEAEATPSRP